MAHQSSSSSTFRRNRITNPNDIRFDVFCRFLENLNRTKKKKDKQDHIWGFLRPFSDQDLWPIFRLMWPASDRHRGNYEMKEKKLGILVAKVLGLPPAEKKRLANWYNKVIE